MSNLEGNRKLRRVRNLVITPVMLSLLAGATSIAQAQDERSRSSADIEGAASGASQYHLTSPIEGSWIFNIDNLTQGSSFHSLISFTAGGVVITSASLPTPSPFYGSWQRSEWNSFKTAFYAFVPDASGKGVITAKVSLRLRLRGHNELTGTGLGYNCDVQGENCTPGDSFQFTGSRIPSE